jgi:hypothetical protein
MKSSYTQYLPPVLWSYQSDPDQFLARMLHIFEKILTGINDGVPLVIEDREYWQIIDGLPQLAIEDREYCPFEQIINGLSQLFDPWRTPASFLPRLAAWLALDLPDVSEDQQRLLIAAIASIYQGRGTKDGLLDLLAIYGAGCGRPRIAIDDGEALFAGRLGAGDTTLVPLAYSRTFMAQLADKAVEVAQLLYPCALALGQDGSIIVVDQGDLPGILPAIWQLSPAGEAPYTSSQNDGQHPRPL